MQKPGATLTAIVAMSRNGVIGHEGRLPWHLPEDLKRFRQLTWGHTLIMGRATFASIGKALPGRTNFVVSRNPALVAEGCQVFAAPAAALAAARHHDDRPYLIGGAALYRELWSAVTHVELTLIDRDVAGDTCFPFAQLPWQEEFEETERRPALSASDVHFLSLQRKTYAQRTG